ncbi:MAG TPA: thrombospondin type 3 repeat-containing protein [Acidimicrobiales bacterium]|jgi:hypothetical protein|nr:thrombospondin type 3 repeat-containing protein [Acidimicrobiales bacterium]
MRLRLGVIAATAALLLGASAAWGDDAPPRGLDNACTRGAAGQHNPHCTDERRGNGGRGSHGGRGGSANDPGPSRADQVTGCLADADGNGAPDGCDTDDADDDGVPNQFDNCRNDANHKQDDADRDGIGDACDAHPNDADHDGVRDDVDNCPNDYNPDQANVDRDDEGGDVCDGDDYAGADNDRPDEVDEARVAVDAIIDEVQAALP